jgi:SNF2 family DNA or RNA helicase
MLTTRQWKLDGSHLGVTTEQGMLWPSALETFEILAEGRSSEPLPCANGDAKGLELSPVPLALRIRLLSGDAPSFQLIGAGGAAEVEVPLTSLKHDHVVVGQTWHPIDCESRDEVAELLPAGTKAGRIHSLRLFASLARAAATGGPVEDLSGGKSFDATAFIPRTAGAPHGITANLYPYQQDGWRWLQFCLSERLGGLLGDEMGLGKTLQVISLFTDPGSRNIFPALVIAPGSLLENWCREIAKFAPGLKILKHHGGNRTGRYTDLRQYDVIITSYDTVLRDGGMMGMIEWPIVILDEAQWIRNPDADRTRAVKQLRRQTAFAVTGTPVENRLSDFWSIMDFVAPGHLGTRSDFEKNYANDIDGALRLEKIASPLMLRRRVAEVANDLPPRIDIPVAIELTESEAVAYENIRNAIASKYGRAANLVAIGQLRMFCAHPVLVGAPAADFSKFSRLIEIIEEIFACSEKVIIFTSYNDMAARIAEFIRTRFNVFTGCINGSVAIDERQPLIDNFSAVEGSAALVLNPKAGGAGLNITAANHVIHYNLEWNPALEDQASARSHRRGQERPVTVHRLFCAGTVEEVVDDRLSSKRALASAAVVGITGSASDYADLARALAISPMMQGK